MPKQVDHEQRRRELIEALWRVAERDGLNAVSFREVATEAGVSVRRVQYYLGTKAELLAAALNEVGRRIVERGLDEMNTLGPDASPRDTLRAAVRGSLPADRDGRTLLLLFFSFYIAAITNETLRSSQALEAPRWTIPFVAQHIRTAQQDGLAPSDLDPDQEAIAFMSSVAGLGLSVLAGLRTTTEAMDNIEYQLDRLFPGR